MALINNLGTVISTVNKANNASGAGLNAAFGISQKQIDNQMEELKNKAENILRGVGMFLLPGVKDLANWSDDVFKYFEKHPLISKIASDAAIGLFAASVAYKVGKGLVSVFNGIKSIFSGTAMTANTVATQENTDALLGRSGTSAVSGAEAGAAGGAAGGEAGVVSEFGGAVTIFAGAALVLGAAIAAKHFIVDPLQNPSTGLSSVPQGYVNGEPKGKVSNKAPKKGDEWYSIPGSGTGAGMWMTPKQLADYLKGDTVHLGAQFAKPATKPKAKVTINHIKKVSFGI
jgi:biotin operon repressor